MNPAQSLIESGAVLAPSTRVGPWCMVSSGSQLGERVTLLSHVVLLNKVTLSDGVQVDPFAVIGGDPQSLSFDPATESAVKVGPETRIREHVTIHRATVSGESTVVGAACLLMAGSHIGHDCLVGDRVVLANGSALGGHVTVGDGTFLGGGAMVHQNCRIGEGAMVAGGAEVSYDVPPFTLTSGRSRAHGLNLIGLKRRGTSREAIAQLKQLYRIFLLGQGPISERAARATEIFGETLSPESVTFFNFFQSTKRGYIRAERNLSHE
jgi:UDP-N-acetylglucosamine acyltransferase